MPPPTQKRHWLACVAALAYTHGVEATFGLVAIAVVLFTRDPSWLDPDENDRRALHGMWGMIRVDVSILFFFLVLFLACCIRQEGDCLLPNGDCLIAVRKRKSAESVSQPSAPLLSESSNEAVETSSGEEDDGRIKKDPPGIADTQTAKYYLAFLRLGFTACTLLYVLSACASLHCRDSGGWWRHLLGTHGVTSITFVTFPEESSCETGYLPLHSVPSSIVCPNVTAFKPCRQRAMYNDATLLAFNHDRGGCYIFGASRMRTLTSDDCEERSNSSLANLAGRTFTLCHAAVRQQDFAIFLLTVVYGALVLLLSVSVYLGKGCYCKRRAIAPAADAMPQDEAKREWKKHTVWFRGVPVRDADDGERYSLSSTDIKRMGKLIAAEISKHLDRRCEKSLVVKVGVVTEKSGIEEFPYRLSGHVFAIMKNAKHAELLRQRKGLFGMRRCLPQWLTWRNYSLIKLGQAPFNKVVLRCQTAPPITDIVWNDLHKQRRWVTSYFLELSFFIFMMALVSPDWLGNHLNSFVQHQKANNAWLSKAPTVLDFVQQELAPKIASYWLTLINYILLPYAIAAIASWFAPALKSEREGIEFGMNNLFLVLLSLVLPFFGWQAGRHSPLQKIELSAGTANSTASFVTQLGHRLQESTENSSTTMMMNYVLSAGLITGGTQLVQMMQTIIRYTTSCCSTWQPPDFAWGYWYAWAMSIFYLGVVMSVVLPAVTFYAALFFLVKFYVDRANFSRKTFKAPAEMDHTLEIKVMSELVHMVSLFWFAMAIRLVAKEPSDRFVVSHMPVVIFPGSALQIKQIDIGFVEPIPAPFLYDVKESMLRFSCFMLIIIVITGLSLLKWVKNFFFSILELILKEAGLEDYAKILSYLAIWTLRVVAGGLTVKSYEYWPNINFVNHPIPTNQWDGGMLFCLGIIGVIAKTLVWAIGSRRLRGVSVTTNSPEQDVIEDFDHDVLNESVDCGCVWVDTKEHIVNEKLATLSREDTTRLQKRAMTFGGASPRVRLNSGGAGIMNSLNRGYTRMRTRFSEKSGEHGAAAGSGGSTPGPSALHE